MTGAKFDIEKFDETGNFELWRIKMRALLIQHGCEAALEVLPADMEAQTKADLNKKAHSAMILCLGYKVLREVTGETTTAEVWSKLDTLYMIKSVANKLYLKKKLYTFYMPTGQKISKHIDEFNKIVLDLSNIEVKFKDKDLALLLLTFLPASYEHFVGRSKAKGGDGEGLYMRGRTDRRDSRQSRGKSRSKSRGGRLKCYICQSADHLKINCSKNNRKKSTGYVKKDEQPSSSGSTYDDSEDGDSVQLGDNRECKIRGELNASFEEKDSLTHFGIKDWDISARRDYMKVTSNQFRCRKAHYSESDRLCSFRLMRSSQVDSLGGKRYFLSIIDDYSKRKFEQLCIESRIPRHLTVDGTPQQNGIAEQMNKTLMDKVRCLLIHSGLPKTFWVEATCTAAYLINRSPSTVIEKKTLVEMWSGHPSNYEMLRIFGCVTYPYDKQVACEDSSKWKAAMKEEMDSLRKNKTWELVDHPAGKSYDMLIACKSKDGIGSTESLLKKEFDMKKLEEAKKILGMEIVRDWSRKILRVSQSGYVSKILNNFRIDNGKSLKMSVGGRFKLSLKDCSVKDCDVERMTKVTYANAVRSLMYLMVCTRPDIAYAISVVSRYLANPGLVYGTNRGNHVDVTGFVDSDYAKDPDKDREVLEAKTVKVLKVGTRHNDAYALTNVDLTCPGNAPLKTVIVPQDMLSLLCDKNNEMQWTFPWLAHNLRLEVNDSIHVGLAYRERLMDFFWKSRCWSKAFLVYVYWGKLGYGNMLFWFVVYKQVVLCSMRMDTCVPEDPLGCSELWIIRSLMRFDGPRSYHLP
nr:retrovirus-related Pol polyprotein from transposon TNT 1-94 [Tanacetum cinerariifolium]